MIVGEECRAELLRKSDVDGVGRRHVVSSGPCIRHKRCDSCLPKVPSTESVDRLIGPHRGEGLRDDGLMSEHAEHFDVEVLRYPQLGVMREKPRKGTPT